MHYQHFFLSVTVLFYIPTADIYFFLEKIILVIHWNPDCTSGYIQLFPNLKPKLKLTSTTK